MKPSISCTVTRQPVTSSINVPSHLCSLSIGVMTMVLSMLLMLVLTLAMMTNAYAASNQAQATADDFDATLLNNIEGTAIAENEAIANTFGKSLNQTSQAQASANQLNSQPVKPITSNRASVSANKLILKNPVIDQAKILTSTEKRQLTAKLRSLHQRGLAQAAVVIVPSTNGSTPFDYAMQVADRWKLGNADVDNGLLILVAVNDRDMYILTGYGLEGVFPDGAVGNIIRKDITPKFKQNDYAGGLLAGIDRIEKRLTTDPATLAQADKLAKEQKPQSTIETIVFALFLMFIVGKMVISILGRVLGSTLAACGAFFICQFLGLHWFFAIVLALFLWIYLLSNIDFGRSHRSTWGDSGYHYDSGDDDDFGSFGGGGFGGGGFSGGGGFGGGGAGGSW